MHYTYRTQGVCSTKIDFDIIDGVVSGVNYENGCNGNLKAISMLVEGMKAQDVVKKLRGIRCGSKNTSCSDQLASAIAQAGYDSK